MWIFVCKFCLGEKHFRNLSDSYIKLVDSIVPLMQFLLFQIRMAIKQMSPKSKTGREKISEKTWQGDGNPSQMTWNWSKQPKAASAPSSNRMNHRQLSRKARKLCKDRGTHWKCVLRASWSKYSLPSHYIQSTELGTMGVAKKVYP